MLLLCFCCVFAPFPEKGILDFIAHRPIIQVFTVLKYDTVDYGTGLTRHYCLYDSYFPLKSRFATTLDLKRNSGYMKQYDCRSSLHRIRSTFRPVMSFPALFF